MISLAIALDAATRYASTSALQAAAPATCDASAASASSEPSLSSGPDCDQSVANTMASPNQTLTAEDYVPAHRHHHVHFNPFGVFGHHHHRDHERRARHGNQDPMHGRDVPVTMISRSWHTAYNSELKAVGSDQPLLQEVSVRVMSYNEDGTERNVAHVVLPMKDTSTMLTGVWRQYRAKQGDYRLVLDGTTLEIVARGEQPVARYTRSVVTGFTRGHDGLSVPVTKISVFEAPIVTEGGAHRGYKVADVRYAIETEALPGA